MRPWLLLVAAGLALSLCGCAAVEPEESSSASSSSSTEFDHDFSEPHSSSATYNGHHSATSSNHDSEHSTGGPHVESFLATVDWIDGGNMQVSVLDPQSEDSETVFLQYDLDYLMDGTLMDELRAGDKINVEFITSGFNIPSQVQASSITLAKTEA